MISILPLLLAAAAAPDPCAAVGKAPAPDPQAAEAYLAVGEAERLAGAAGTATAAFRAALFLDPENQKARDALAGLCREAQVEALFAEASRQMDAGDLPGAAALFAQLRSEEPSPAAALLEGICRYELDQNTEAGRRFLEARADPELASDADFYLGLLALRSGDAAAATRRFSAVGAESGLRTAADDLVALSRTEGRLVVFASVEGGYDSNADLAVYPTMANADAALTATALVLARPWGASGPFAQVAAGYRKYLRPVPYELGLSGGDAQTLPHLAYQPGLVGGEVGWQFLRRRATLMAEYGFDYLALGGSPQLSSHRLLAEAAVPLDHLVLGALYLHRWDSVWPAAEVLNSGNRDSGELRAAWRFSPGTSAAVGYAVVRHLAEEAPLSFLEHGPLAEVRIEPRRGVRVAADGALRLRGYDAFDKGLGVQRADSYLEGRVRAEADLTFLWSLLLTLEARQVLSNVGELENTRFAASLGVAFALGVL